jgi:biotin synthase
MMAFRLFFPKINNNVIPVKLLSKTPVRRLASETPAYTRPLSAAGLFSSGHIRHDWTREEIKSIYDSPTMDLLYFGVS